MSQSEVLLLAFLIGVVAGLRSMTAPAAVAWAAYHGWVNLLQTPLAFFASGISVVVFIILATGELVADKLPKAPSRTKAPGLITRIVAGGLCGAALSIVAGQSIILGAVLGSLGGIAGAFAGYQLRTGLVKALKLPDFVIALLEDAVAIGSGLLIVSKF